MVQLRVPRLVPAGGVQGQVEVQLRVPLQVADVGAVLLPGPAIVVVAPDTSELLALCEMAIVPSVVVEATQSMFAGIRETSKGPSILGAKICDPCNRERKLPSVRH